MTNPAATPLLHLADVSITVAGKCLIRGLDLELAPGEVVALVGPSGCGKTTLLRTVAGLIDPAEGRIELGGQTGDELGWPAFRRRAVLVSQQPALYEDSVESCLRRPFRYHSAQTPYSEKCALELLQELGLGEIPLEKSVRDCSVGERQRLCLARALLIEPEVLLLDEPTSALDAANVAAAEDAVTTAATEHGLSALVVTHNLEQARRWCTRVCDLADLTDMEGARD